MVSESWLLDARYSINNGPRAVQGVEQRSEIRPFPYQIPKSEIANPQSSVPRFFKDFFYKLGRSHYFAVVVDTRMFRIALSY